MLKTTTRATLIWLTVVVFVFSATLWHFTPMVESTKTIAHDPTRDARYIRLARFFAHYECENLALVYLNASEKYGLDYRLLPALSLRESSCGKHSLYNNWWGWGSSSGLWHFDSVPAGIDLITKQLSLGERYKNLSIRSKLSIYGPKDNPTYASEVLQIMHQIEK